VCSWDHPQNEKASRRELNSLGGSTFKTFGWRAFMAISRRFRVMLKVNRKTDLCENYSEDRPFGGNVQIFYVTDIALD
jgi:hypothetical protein